MPADTRSNITCPNPVSLNMKSPHFAIAALCACAALTAAGCSTSSTLNTDKAESAIKDALIEQAKTKVASVDCPEREAKKGDTFTCTAKGEDGTTAVVTVIQKDDDGNVTFDSPVMHTAEVEEIVVGQMKQKLPSLTSVTVDCPDLITGKSGATFVCKGMGDGKPFTVNATQTNDKGGFTFSTKTG